MNFIDRSETVPVIDGIPRFASGPNYADAFGLQWNAFRRTQLDSFTGATISEDRLRAALGRDLRTLRDKRVLEAGSGAGRFTEVLLKYGAEVYSFDYSRAIDANAANNLPHHRLTLWQGDIRDIPFRDNAFDAVICLGVLQHTPHTAESLAELVRVLKPSGDLVTDHYAWHLGLVTSLYLVWWHTIKRLPASWRLPVTGALTAMFFPLHWRFRDSPLAQKLLRRISPINFYYGQFDLPKGALYEWCRLDAHDRNTDNFKRHMTRRRYARLLDDAGIDGKVLRGTNGYIGRGVKRLRQCV